MLGVALLKQMATNIIMGTDSKERSPNKLERFEISKGYSSILGSIKLLV